VHETLPVRRGDPLRDLSADPRSTSLIASGPWEMRSASVTPSRSSMTRKSCPPSEPMSKRAHRFGCWTCEIDLASCSKRRRWSRLSCRCSRQHLDRHVPFEARIASLVDLPHPARTERSGDLVRTQTGPFREVHDDEF
jgi:hypothetical protein